MFDVKKLYRRLKKTLLLINDDLTLCTIKTIEEDDFSSLCSILGLLSDKSFHLSSMHL